MHILLNISLTSRGEVAFHILIYIMQCYKVFMTSSKEDSR